MTGPALRPTVPVEVLRRFPHLRPTSHEHVFAGPGLAFGFDPGRADPQQLDAHGFSWRRPTTREHDLQALWDKVFAVDWRSPDLNEAPQLTPRRPTDPRRRSRGDGAHENEFFNWAGVATERSRPLTSVMGTWTVPVASLPLESPGVNNGYQASVWVGIDGFHNDSNDLLQTGIELEVDASGHATYSAWYEWFVEHDDAPPAWVNSDTFDGFVVAPGDTIYAGASYLPAMTDPDDVNRKYGSVWIANARTKDSRSLVIWGPETPHRADVLGQSAEWIVETPYYQGVDEYSTLPNFTPVTFTGAVACGNPAVGPTSADGVVNIDSDNMIVTNTTVPGPNQVRVRRVFWYADQDSSGKIFTKVSPDLSTVSKEHSVDFPAVVDDNLVCIGGGGSTNDPDPGALLTASYPADDHASWYISTKDHEVVSPHSPTAYAIGLFIEGMTRAELINAIQIFRATSAMAEHPSVTATVPADYVMLGGGFRVSDHGDGNLATASYPSSPSTWTVASKDHLVPSPATIEAYAIGIRRKLPVGTVVAHIEQATSKPAASHPSATAVLPPGFALCGGGGHDHWQGAGNMLWGLTPAVTVVPGMTPSSFTADGKDHVQPDPSTITAYTIGIKLQPT